MGRMPCGAERCARPQKRVAARGCARARRAVGGFACKHTSAQGPALAMQASPPPDTETRFAGHESPTERGLIFAPRT